MVVAMGSLANQPRTTADSVNEDRFEIDREPVFVRHLESDDEAHACARIMAASEPWITLRRDYDASLALLRDPFREAYVAVPAGGADVLGFVIIVMHGAFVGYIQSIATREDWRGRGLGTHLIAFAESRIFRETPNAFICASSFNDRARALYARLGYETIGELRDYVVSGQSEISTLR